MPQVGPFPPIDSTVQIQTVGVDFGDFLAPGATLAGEPTVTIAVVQGLDATPNSRLLGNPQIATVPKVEGGTGLPNTSILQQVGDLVGGVIYRLQFVCARSDSTDVVSAWATVPSDTPPPG